MHEVLQRKGNYIKEKRKFMRVMIADYSIWVHFKHDHNFSNHIPMIKKQCDHCALWETS